MDEYLRNQLSVSDQWRERAEAGPRPAERIALGETPTPDRQQPSRGLADHDLNEHIIIGVLRREPVIGFIRSREVGLADRPVGCELRTPRRQLSLRRGCRRLPSVIGERL